MTSDGSAPAAHGASTFDHGLDEFKECLSDPRFRIRLDDLVNRSVREALLAASDEKFPLDTGRVGGDDFLARLTAYEHILGPLQSRAALLGRWCTAEQRPSLSRLLARLCDFGVATAGGSTLWGGLRWYPVNLSMYSAGIGALSAENYAALSTVLTKKISAPAGRGGNAAPDLTCAVADAMLGVSSTNAWKCVEEYKQKRTPESEHLFKVLRPGLEDTLFLGSEFAHVFDRFEVLRSLHYADVTDGGRGPLGRFAWKYWGRGMADTNPVTDVRLEAAQSRDGWGPIRAGLFRGSYARFEQVAATFEKELLGKLNWH